MSNTVDPKKLSDVDLKQAIAYYETNRGAIKPEFLAQFDAQGEVLKAELGRREAYNLVLSADEAFSAELVRVHGKNAGDYRYQPSKDTPQIAKLRVAYRASVQAYDKYRGI